MIKLVDFIKDTSQLQSEPKPEKDPLPVEPQTTDLMMNIAESPKSEPEPCLSSDDSGYAQLWSKALDIYNWALKYIHDENAPVDYLRKLIKKLEGDEEDLLWSDIIRSLTMNNDLICKIFTPKEEYNLLVDHGVDVAILSLKLGIGINKYSKEELKHLGIAALFHDFGLAAISMFLLKKDTELSEDEVEVIKRHPTLAKSFLSKLGKEYEWLANICYQKHERENGKDYPEGLSKNKKTPIAKIISLSDTFVSLCNHAQGKSVSPVEAIRTVLRIQKDFFSKELAKVLLTELTPFPPGSFVQINSKEIGQVIRVSKKHPTRPDLRIDFDATGKPSKERKIMHLQSKPLLYIIRSFTIDEYRAHIL